MWSCQVCSGPDPTHGTWHLDEVGVLGHYAVRQQVTGMSTNRDGMAKVFFFKNCYFCMCVCMRVYLHLGVQRSDGRGVGPLRAEAIHSHREAVPRTPSLLCDCWDPRLALMTEKTLLSTEQPPHTHGNLLNLVILKIKIKKKMPGEQFP